MPTISVRASAPKRRPDWYVCVISDVGETHELHGKTWCGRPRGPEFYFQSVDHAAIYGRTMGRLVVCPECLIKIVAGLANGHKVVEP